MQRTRKTDQIPTCILTGDWHLREDTPVCRTEREFQIAQWNKVDFIWALQKKYDCPVIHSGDLFNHWKPSPWLLSKAMEHLPEDFYTIYGNHDLPQHNLELADRCGINVLLNANKLTVLNTCHWGNNPSEVSLSLNHNADLGTKVNMLVWHVMNYQGPEPWPGCTDMKAAGLLRKYKYDLILTGHNHIPFVEEHQGRLLVNPGSIMRQSASQMDFKPRVYLWYAETNTVVPVYLPIEEGVISREHIEIQEQRENRLDAFVSKLNTDWEISLSFEDNLDAFARNNNIKDNVMKIIYAALE